MKNCSKFGHFILNKIIENCCHQMSYFEAKIHQIRFRLGLRPRPRWGSLQRSPRPPSWNSGDLLLRGRGGKGRGKEGKGKERGGVRGQGAASKRKSCLRHCTALCKFCHCFASYCIIVISNTLQIAIETASVLGQNVLLEIFHF